MFYMFVAEVIKTHYKITFRMKSNVSSTMYVRFMTKDWQTTLCSEMVTPSTEWEEYTVTFNSGDNTGILLMLQSNGVVGQMFWFDDVTCTPC